MHRVRNNAVLDAHLVHLVPLLLKPAPTPFLSMGWKSGVFAGSTQAMCTAFCWRSSSAHANGTWPSGSWRYTTEVLRLCRWYPSILNHAASYWATRTWRAGFVFGFCLVNSNLFCGDFPAVILRDWHVTTRCLQSVWGLPNLQPWQGNIYISHVQHANIFYLGSLSRSKVLCMHWFFPGGGQ